MAEETPVDERLWWEGVKSSVGDRTVTDEMVEDMISSLQAPPGEAKLAIPGVLAPDGSRMPLPKYYSSDYRRKIVELYDNVGRLQMILRKHGISIQENDNA